MVSNSKDDHPSKATPITNIAVNTHPRVVLQASTQPQKPVSRKRSK